MRVASGKAKGRKLQQRVVKKILEMFPDLEEDDVVSRPMGSSGEDIMLSPLARRKLKASFECKARKSIAVYSWYSQCAENAPEGSEPIVIIKADRKKPLAVVDAEWILDQLRK